MAADKPNTTGPQILEMPAQKMAAVYARGAPEEVFPRVLPDLYGSVRSINFELERKGSPTFEVGGLRTRFPDAHLVPYTEWTYVIGLPVPQNIRSVPQRIGGIEIKLEIWEYGTVAQILQSVGDNPDNDSVDSLHRHIIDNGYEIVGVHEEEYLMDADGKNNGTIFRYRIREK
jgi:hypothetical protein